MKYKLKLLYVALITTIIGATWIRIPPLSIIVIFFFWIWIPIICVGFIIALIPFISSIVKNDESKLKSGLVGFAITIPLIIGPILSEMIYVKVNESKAVKWIEIIEKYKNENGFYPSNLEEIKMNKGFIKPKYYKLKDDEKYRIEYVRGGAVTHIYRSEKKDWLILGWND